MKKCILVPDSFKGTLSAIEICQLSKPIIEKHFPDCQVVALPVADGGEGTVDCFAYALGASLISLEVQGPYGHPVTAKYALHGDTAFLEMAQAAGLPMVEDCKNPALTSTYGVGEMMLDAVRRGCRRLIIGLGGSCTNDGGAGAAAALGTVFSRRDGSSFLPVGGTLHEIASIDTSKTKELLKDCTVTAMCDIDNPMYGKDGAAYVFGPQKGADEYMTALLDNNLRHLAQAMETSLQIDPAHLPGAGAAGGFGAGIAAFFGGALKSGIETVLDTVDFDRHLKDADLVITGEGQIDSQSLHGKVIMGVAARAAKEKTPVVVLTGSVGEGGRKAYDLGVSAIFSINQKAEDFSLSRWHARENFADELDALMRFYKAMRSV